MENKLILSDEAKKVYLQKLSKRLIKILYLIEDELNNKKESTNEDGTTNAQAYILGQLFEVNSSNILFDNALIDIVVKLNGILDYATLPYSTIRKQIFEAKGIIDHMLKNL